MGSLIRIRTMFLLLLMATATVWAQQPVVSRSPEANSRDVYPSSTVSITLTDQYNLATVNSSSFRVWGSQSGFHTGTYSVINSGATLHFNPTVDFTPGEDVSVTITTDVEQTNTLNLSFPISWTFSVGTSDNGVYIGNYSYMGTGSNAAGITTADVNKDGRVDVITANQGSSNISVFLNNSDNTVASHVTYAMGTGAYSVIAADLNSDGYPDIVTGNYNANTISVRLNNGDGTFGAVSHFNTGYVPRDIASADIDGDGDIDIVVANSDTDDLSVLKNDGTGSFAAHVTTPLGNLPAGIATADLNDDGYIDIAVTTLAADSVLVLLNNGTGTFSSITRYAAGDAPWGVSLADLDADGDADLIVASSLTNQILVRFNNGSGVFGLATGYSTGNNPRGVAVGDVDGDGDLDIAVAAHDVGMVSLLKNNGSGVFAAAVNLTTTAGTHDVAFGDLSGDGDVDIVAASYESSSMNIIPNLYGPRISSYTPTRAALNITPTADVVIVFSEPMDASSITNSTFKVYGSLRGKYTGSLSYNNSNYTVTFNPDSAFFHGERITVFLSTGLQNASDLNMVLPYAYEFTVTSNTGYGAFAPAANYTVMGGGGGASASVGGDFNRDGLIDIATVSQVSHTLSVFLNTGNGTLGTRTDIANGSYPRGIVSADIDGDGDLDLLTARNSSGCLSVFFNNGSGTFASKVDYNTGINASGLVSFDLDMDGDLDVVMTDTGNDRLVINYNNGSGVFGDAVFVATGDSPGSISAADFNRDGFTDIAATNYSTDNASVHFNNQSGGLGTAVNHAVGDSPTGVITGNVNGDDYFDFVTANSSANTATKWASGSGVSLFTTASYSIGDYPSSIALVNLDADYDLELITANLNTSNISFAANNGSGVFGTASNYSLASTPDHVLGADMNNDGRMDLVTSNSNGTVSVLMNSDGGDVVSVSPVNGSDDIAASTNVSVTFNQDMDPASMTSATVKVIGSESGLHAGSYSYNAGTFTLTINPTNDFSPGEKVTVSVTRGVEDVNNVPLTAAYASQFFIESNSAGAFGAMTNYTVGDQPERVVAADLNNDGHPDIATANNASDDISIRLNNGDGTFGAVSSVSAGDGPSGIAAGDVDGDGDMDLVVSLANANQLARFLNNGSGVFGVASTFSTSGTPKNVVLADIDADGDHDAVYTAGSYVFSQANNGSGSFSTENNGKPASTPMGLAVADIDNDGDLDFLVVNNASNSIGLSRYNGSNWYASTGEYATGSAPSGIMTGDFNGDGFIDVVTTNLVSGNGTISYLQNNISGGFATKVDYALGAGAQPRGGAALDIDGDGDLDLAVVNGAADSVVVFTNNGSGSFIKGSQFATGDNPYAIAAADIDGDGDMDIATANYTGDNISVLKATTPVSISSIAPTANDLDIAASANVVITFNQSMNASTLNANTVIVSGSQRGKYSGAYGHSSGVLTFNPDNNFKAGEIISILVTTGVQNPDGGALSAPQRQSFVVAASAEGTFGSKLSFSTIENPVDLAAADMDGDGDNDVVTVNGYSKTISVLLNNGSGSLSAADTIYEGASNQARYIKVADFDGDGDFDVVVANQSSNSFSVLFNNGSGAFPNDPVVYSFADSYPTIDVGDVDNDGDVDLIVVKYGTNQAFVYLNNGSGTFSAQSPVSTGTGPWGVALGDLNSDGYLDFVTTDYDGNTLSVLLNNGNGTYASAASVNPGISYPDGITMGDVDGDGDLDLAVSAWDDGKSSVLMNNGSGTFGTATTYSNDGPSKIALADVDGDGDLDLVTTEGGLNRIYVRLNSGSGNFSQLVTYSAGSYPQSVALVDMDGDGDLDIVSANASGGNVAILKNIELVKVNSTSPSANADDIAKTSNIAVTFNSDMNSATLVDTTVILHGSMTGHISGVISYDGPSKTMTFNPANDFFAGEEVSITLTSNIKNTNGINLHSPFSTSFTVHVAGAGNFVYHDSIPDLGQDGSNPYNFGSFLYSGDVTEDGKTDLMRAYPGNIKVLKNNTTSFDSVSFASISNTSFLPLADLDDDGDLDMIQVNYSNNNMTVLLNDGMGSFTPQTPVNTGVNYPRNLILKDMDNDGHIDATLNGNGSQQVYTFYNDGMGNFSNAVYSAMTIHYDIYDFDCADVNNDGLNDIITLHSGNGNNFVSITMNSGERSFVSPVDYTIAEGGRKMTAADVNGDGYADIIVANQNGFFFSVILNNANGTFASAVNYNFGFTLYQIAPADMDGDGDLDVVVRGYDDDNSVAKLVLAYNNGSGVFGNQLEFNFKANAPDYYSSHSDIALLDYDTDGDLDIAVQAQRYYGSNQYWNTLLFKNVAGSSSTPTVAASSVTTSGISGSRATIQWTKGNGSRRLVLMRQGSAVNGTPSDNGNFSPNAVFTSGSQVVSGNYVVYGGSGSSVTVTGLSKSTTYHVSVFEINGLPGGELVLTTAAPTASFTTSQFDGPFDQTPGYALNFDGRWNQSNNSFSMNDSFTVEMWVKPSLIGSNMTILVHGNNKVWIGINASGNFFARVYDDNLEDDHDFTGTTTTAVANQWYHVALTAKNNQTAKLYVNGALEASSSSTVGLVYSSGNTLYPGGDYNSSSYRGLLDELRIWNSVRSESEIRSNMHKTFEGIPANLSNYWQFNEGTGNSSAELVSNNNMVESDDPLLWATSDAPVGGGTNASSSVAANTIGIQNVGNVKLNMSNGFDSPTDVYVSEVLVAPNSYPTNYNSSVGDKYFVIDAFPYPTPGSFSTTLTLSYGAGVLTDNNAANYILYKRGSSSTGSWTSFGGASSVNIATGEVSWNGITSFSQAVVVNQNDVLPVELISFTATATNGSVELLWKTATELNNSGFEIERSVVNSTQKRSGEWTKIGAVEGNGTTNTSHAYSFIDASVKGNARYRLKQIDRDGGFAYSNVLEVTVAAPSVFALQQNYPNPFNPSTVLEFTLAVNGLTTLKIYDAIGREVATLVNNEMLESGVYHQKQFDARNLSSGVYFARLVSGSNVQMKKMMLLK